MSKPQPHIAEKSATYENLEQLERSTFWPRVPFTKAIELNPKPERGSLSDELQVSFVPMASVEAGTGAIDASAVRKYAEVKKGYTYFREGDVLFAKITPCMENGKMAVARQLRNGIGFGSTEFHVLRPREGVDAHYIYHYVSSARFRAEAAHHMTGAVGQKRVPAAFLEQSEIPLPPIDQQRCIVAEIEKQFSRLDEAVANLKRVKANLKRYRTNVLKTTVGEALGKFESLCLGKFLGKGGLFIDGDWVESKDQDPQGEVRLIQLADIGDGVYRDKSTRFLTKQKATELRCTFLKPGDVLIARMPEPLGRACIFPGDDKESVTVVDVCIVRGVPEQFDYRWLMHTLNAPQCRSQISALQAGSTRKRISRKNLATIQVPIVPIDEQREIAAEVERRFSVIEELEAIVAANFKRAERLRHAILANVFRDDLGAHFAR